MIAEYVGIVNILVICVGIISIIIGAVIGNIDVCVDVADIIGIVIKIVATRKHLMIIHYGNHIIRHV